MQIYNSTKRFNGRNGWIPDIIVCHRAEGTNIPNYFMNTTRQVSSNFVVGIDGKLSQIVDIKNGAWCNGTSTLSTSSVYYGKSTHPLVKSRKTNANYYTISIEFEGFAKNPLNDAQIKAGIELIKWIKTEVKKIWGKDLLIDRTHVIGHYEVNPKTKPNCPGKLFPYTELIEGANELVPIKNELEEENKELQNKLDIVMKENEELKNEIKKYTPMTYYIKQ